MITQLRAKAVIFFSAILAPVLLCSGCVSSLKHNTPEKKYFLLDISFAGEAAEKPSYPALKIRNFRVTPPWAHSKFIYRTHETEFVSDYYNEFLISPRENLTQEVREWLTATGQFQSVTAIQSHVPANWILEGSLTAMYADIRDNDKPRAVMEIQLFLLQDNRGQKSVLFQKSYQRNLEVESAKPEKLAAAWNAALEQILSQFVDDLEQSASQQPQSQI